MSNNNGYELEVMREIWPPHGDGEYLEIGPDRDGLELIEIRQKESNGKISARISLRIDEVKLVVQALEACAVELEES